MKKLELVACQNSPLCLQFCYSTELFTWTTWNQCKSIQMLTKINSFKTTNVDCRQREFPLQLLGHHWNRLKMATLRKGPLIGYKRTHVMSKHTESLWLAVKRCITWHSRNKIKLDNNITKVRTRNSDKDKLQKGQVHLIRPKYQEMYGNVWHNPQSWWFGIIQRSW